MVGLVDCDNFFCSCERVFRPDLAGKPIVVLSNNDGCVVARFREVKAMGIKEGMPSIGWWSSIPIQASWPFLPTIPCMVICRRGLWQYSVRRFRK